MEDNQKEAALLACVGKETFGLLRALVAPTKLNVWRTNGNAEGSLSNTGMGPYRDTHTYILVCVCVVHADNRVIQSYI